MEAFSRCGSERDAHWRCWVVRAEAGPASSRSRSNVWMGYFQRWQSWCSSHTEWDATLEAIAWDLSVHRSLCICPYMSSSAGVNRRAIVFSVMRVAVLHYIRHNIWGLEKWVSARLVIPSHCFCSSLLVLFSFRSLSDSQSAPRIKTKHFWLSVLPAAAWMWVKLAKFVTFPSFFLLEFLMWLMKR